MLGMDVEDGVNELFAEADTRQRRRQETKVRKKDIKAAARVRDKGRITGTDPVRFQTFAKSYLKLPNHLVHVYLEWLIDHPEYQLGPEDGLMMGVRDIPYLPRHTRFPYPSGSRWEAMVAASGVGGKLISRKATTREYLMKLSLIHI